MPLWAIIASLCIAAVPGLVGLFVAALNMGAIRRDVHDLVQRAGGWDSMKTDVAYIKGRLDNSDLDRLTAVDHGLKTVTRRRAAG